MAIFENNQRSPLNMLLLTLTLVTVLTTTKGRDIYITGLFPMADKSPNGEIGRGVLPALQIALEHLNNHRQVLLDHKINLSRNETKVGKYISSVPFIKSIPLFVACVISFTE